MEPASSQIFILIVLLILSAFFSMSETALTSLNKIRLRTMVDENIRNSKLIQKVLEEPDSLITAILIVNNLVNILASSLATYIAMQRFGSKGVGIATGLLTLFVLIFGEITPKTFAAKNAEKVSLFVIKPINISIKILKPIIFILNIITNILFKILSLKKHETSPTITESELLTMVNVSHEEGVLEIDEREMINNVVVFANSDAKDVMIPRTDIIAISLNTNFEDLKKLFQKETFSRMPVFDESIDNIVGIIALKDLLFIKDEKNFKIKDFMREPYFTYESKCLKELFSEMRIKRIPMAIVSDEYGGTSGIVTLEDMLEEIVGDLADEYDEHPEEIKLIKDDEYIIKGGTKIEDVNEILNTNFESEDFESIGGFVIETMGKFPVKGEIFEKDNIKFIIEETFKNRIEKIRILKEKKEES